MRIRLSNILTPLVTILCVIGVVFITLRIVPGNPAQMLLGEMASPESIQALEHQLGIDQPISRQLIIYGKNIIKGDLGISIAQRKPVMALLISTIPYSLALAISAGIVCWLIGTQIAFALIRLENRRAYRKVARLLFQMVFFFASIPSFLLAPAIALLVTRTTWLSWVSISGFDGPRALPTLILSLALSSACSFAVTVRTLLLNELKAPYAQFARAKGLSFQELLKSHLWPVAKTSVMTEFLLFVTHLFSGAVLIESFFDWPGLGTLLVNAIMARDYPVIQGAVLTIALSVVFTNFFIDVWLTRRSDQLQ